MNLILLTFLALFFSPTFHLPSTQVSILTIPRHRNKTRTFIQNKFGTWCSVTAPQLSFELEPSWFTISPKSSNSPTMQDKLRSPNSSSRVLSATCVATISSEADSPLAVRRRPCSCTWIVLKSPTTPQRWPRMVAMWFVLSIRLVNLSSFNCSVVLASWLVLKPSTFGRSNLPSEIRQIRSWIWSG